MQDHDAMEHQVPYHVIELKSPDGKVTRRVGFIAVLSNDPKLYSQFKAPGAFGGAHIGTLSWLNLGRENRLRSNALFVMLWTQRIPGKHLKSTIEFW